MLEPVASALASDPARRLKLVANLPYNIATPVISNLLSTDITTAPDGGHDPEGAG